MIAALLYSVSFVVAIAGFLLVPKTNKCENGIKWLSYSVVTVMCIGALAAYILNYLHITINLVSTAAIYLCIAGICFVIIYKKRRIQVLQLKVYDIMMTIFSMGVMAALFFFIHGENIRLVYKNIDLAVHYQSAMIVVRNQILTRMHFLPFHNAMIMEVLSPVFYGAYYYKSFFIADALMTGLEFLFFVSMLFEMADKRRMKIVIPIVSLLFFLGMPVYGYAVGGFCHWGCGAMISYYIIRMFGEWSTDNRKIYVFMAIMGVGALSFTYILFLPPIVIGLAAGLSYYFLRGSNKSVLKPKNLALIGIVLLLGAGLSLFAVNKYFTGNLTVFMESLSKQGSCYSELYMDFLLLIPFAAYVIVNEIKTHRISTETIFILSGVIFEMFFLALTYMGIVSQYYYYKIYYLLWILIWVLVVRYFRDYMDKEKTFSYIYLCIYLLLAGLSFGKLEEAMIKRVPGMDTWVSENKVQKNDSDSFFGIYHASLKGIFGDKRICSENKTELFDWAVTWTKENGEKIIFVGSDAIYAECLDRAWYDGTAGINSGGWCEWSNDFFEIIEILQGKGKKYCIVLKDSNLYNKNVEYIETFDKLFENQAGVIINIG